MIHPIPWRSEYVDQMFAKTDACCNHKKSRQALYQMKTRKFGSHSARAPPGDSVPEWSLHTPKDD